MTEEMCGRVLLVNDDPTEIESLTNLMEGEGLSVRSCPDAFAALEFAEYERFDVVLSDVEMLAVSGLELLDQIRRLDPDVPVVLMTGFADTGVAIAALKRQAFDFIIKPVVPAMLISILARALNYRRLRTMEREYSGPLKSTVAKNTDELKQHIEELRFARVVAEEYSKLKCEFMANISHEIRTPLNGMVGLVELLSDQEHTDEQGKYYSMLQSATGRLSSLLNNLIDFSKMTSGSVELTETEFCLSGVVEPLVKAYSEKAAAKGLSMSFAPDVQMPDEIIGDELKLSQVLYHILENSIKFTKEGSIALRIETVVNDVFASSNSAMFLFSVSDTGIGIASDKIGTIFDEFRQADGSSTRKHDGAGLGLAIAKQTIQSLGGAIWVESTLGIGSTFYFTVPLKRLRNYETAYC